MAVQGVSPGQGSAGYDGYAAHDERGYGWVAFAGTLLLILGTLNFIEGLAAVSNSHFFVNNTHYIAGIRATPSTTDTSTGFTGEAEPVRTEWRLFLMTHNLTKLHHHPLAAATG